MKKRDKKMYTVLAMLVSGSLALAIITTIVYSTKIKTNKENNKNMIESIVKTEKEIEKIKIELENREKRIKEIEDKINKNK